MDTHVTDSAASEAAISPVVLPATKPSGPPRGLEKWRRKAYNSAMAMMKPLGDIVARTSKVSTEPVLRAEDFAWTRPLEENWREIRRELEGVLEYRDHLPAFHEINGDATTISNDNWKSYFFYGFGRRSDDNCRRCPRTAALIEKVPGVSTAFFSIMAPGVRLPPHKGPWKGFLRYHLGLMVPEPMERCGIEVGGVKAYWREGQSLVFDDTYEHHVWNDTNGTRVVLFLDVVRPCRFPGSLVNQAVIRIAGMTPFVQDSFRRHAAWEKKFAKLHG
jgi:beta-hydroxylase